MFCAFWGCDGDFLLLLREGGFFETKGVSVWETGMRWRGMSRHDVRIERRRDGFMGRSVAWSRSSGTLGYSGKGFMVERNRKEAGVTMIWFIYLIHTNPPPGNKEPRYSQSPINASKQS